MNPQPLITHINQYIDLTSEEEEILSELIGYRKYLKGQYVHHQGDTNKRECFVVKGCLKTFYIDGEGHEHIVLFAIENWWAGDLGSFISQTPADYNIQCLEDTEVIHISYEDRERLLLRIPKLERFYRIIIQNAFVASQKRVISSYSLPAVERYLIFQKQYPAIEQRVPQYMIASYLGITKEFLSKIRSQLAAGK